MWGGGAGEGVRSVCQLCQPGLLRCVCGGGGGGGGGFSCESISVVCAELNRL